MGVSDACLGVRGIHTLLCFRSGIISVFPTEMGVAVTPLHTHTGLQCNNIVLSIFT